MHEQQHLTLSQKTNLPIANRYRHLAVHHLLQRDLTKVCQALCASHSNFKEFLSLEDAKEVLREKETPQWLSNPAGYARFPACLSSEETVNQQDWADFHMSYSQSSCDKDNGLLHVVAMNIFLGFYGFAVQGLFNYETKDHSPLSIPEDPQEMLSFAMDMLDEEVSPLNFPWESPWA